MNRLAAMLLVSALACSDGGPRTVLELTIHKPAGRVTPTDVGRLEQRVLTVQGVTLVSVSADRKGLLIHHDANTDRAQIELALRETGFQWAEVTD